jgi:hypothetical protein
VKVENVPTEKNEQGIALSEQWQNDEKFQHLAGLYIKYIDIYRKLEECYDQMVQPQKRIFIKKVLECSILRICELKKDLILFNTRPNSIYVHLDQLLFDLKYDPSMIEIPVPRYFKEDDRIEVELKFNEKVERDKKKKGKGKPKKKKKKKKDEEPVKEIRIPLAEKDDLMNNLMLTYRGYNEPEREIVQDPFTLEVNIHFGIRLIQKNDRGRQGIARVQMMSKRVDEIMI